MARAGRGCLAQERAPSADGQEHSLPARVLPSRQHAWDGEEGEDWALQPSKEPLPLFLRLSGKADLLWGWVILLAR